MMWYLYILDIGRGSWECSNRSFCRNVKRMEIAYGKCTFVCLFAGICRSLLYTDLPPLLIQRPTISVACPTLPINRLHCEVMRQRGFVTIALARDCNFLLKLTRRSSWKTRAIIPIGKHVYNSPFTSFSLVCVRPSGRSSNPDTLFRSQLCFRTCRSYTMGCWVWRRCVRAETPFSAGSARSYVSRNILRTMSFISKYIFWTCHEKHEIIARKTSVLHQRFLINFWRNKK